MALRDWELGEVLLDHYTVEAHIGVGGMGTVYRVRCALTDQSFAVKRGLTSDRRAQRQFLTELLNWFDLPEYRHLAACHFFRSVEEEIAIFAEYVSGGSLKDWIAAGKLRSPETIIDIAIQMAWGLHAIHERGAVHQDVKSSNVLMTQEGLAKIGDFGLSRAQASSGDTARQQHTLGAAGMTLAYRSPEQANLEGLGPQSDIWSWGVTVLEMFAGEVFWRDGQVASAALDRFLRRQAAEPILSPRVAQVLRKCFAPALEDRWGTISEVADELRRIYLEQTGERFAREEPALPKADLEEGADWRGPSAKGLGWRDPLYWLTRSLEATGRDPAEAESLLYPKLSSPRARVVADLAAYEEAVQLMEGIDSAASDLRRNLAMLYLGKAGIHEVVDDVPGALALCDQAVAILAPISKEDGTPESLSNLAIGLGRRAHAAFLLGRTEETIEFCDRAIRLHDQVLQETLLAYEGHLAAEDLLSTYNTKAGALFRTNRFEESLEIYDHLVAVSRRLVDEFDFPDLIKHHAQAYLNKAICLTELGRHALAIAAYDAGIEIREELARQEGGPYIWYALANAYHHKANSVARELGPKEAGELFDKGIEILERLSKPPDQHDVRRELAMACMNRASALQAGGDLRSALTNRQQALVIWERLVGVEGRHDLADSLVEGYRAVAETLQRLRQYAVAREIVDQGIDLLQRLLLAGYSDLRRNLARLYHSKARVLSAQSHADASLSMYDMAIDTWHVLAQEKVAVDANELGSLYSNKAITLQEMGRLQDARATAAQGIDLVEAVSNRSHDMTVTLAHLYRTQGGILQRQGDPSALAMYQRSLDLFNAEAS